MSFDVYLIRHPKPDIAPGTCYGAMDMPPVDDHLEAVIEYVKNTLPLRNLKAYSSPLQRARLVAEGLDIGHSISPAIAEMGFGDWEGLSWDAIPRREIEDWQNNFMHYADHGGESVARFLQRINNFIELELLQQQQDCILFTHAGVIRSFLHYCGDINLERGNHLELDYGSINHFHLKQGKLRLIATNITP